MPDSVTVGTLHALSSLHTATRKNGRCIFAVYDGGPVVDGVLRGFTDKRGNFLDHADDVMDAYVWISATVEHFIPVRDVIAKMQTGMFGVS